MTFTIQHPIKVSLIDRVSMFNEMSSDEATKIMIATLSVDNIHAEYEACKRSGTPINHNEIYDTVVQTVSELAICQIAEKRAAYCGSFTFTPGALFLLAELSRGNPGKVVQLTYLAFRAFVCNSHKRVVSTLDFLQVFQNGFPPPSVYDECWDAQKFIGQNKLDLFFAWLCETPQRTLDGEYSNGNFNTFAQNNRNLVTMVFAEDCETEGVDAVLEYVYTHLPALNPIKAN